jgi:hypothetical protein
MKATANRPFSDNNDSIIHEIEAGHSKTGTNN